MGNSLSIIGFGNQAKAWALNLRDSGFKVFIGLRTGSASVEAAKKLDFQTFDFGTEPLPCEDAAILAPDDTHPAILKALGDQKANLFFAHGFSLLYEKLAEKHPNFNCLLLAPKAIASEVRMAYETGEKLGGLYSAELSKLEGGEEKIKSLARALGISSLHPTTIEAETKADLFSEQTLLCSTLPYSALMAFNKLIEKGVGPETAYFECWHEVKLIADTMVRLGPAKFFELISPNALAGSEVGRKLLFDANYQQHLENLYNNIDNGDFTKGLSETNFGQLKKEVVDFWKSQRLNAVHEELSKELY